MGLLCLCPEQGGTGLRGPPGLDGPEGVKVWWSDGSNLSFLCEMPFSGLFPSSAFRLWLMGDGVVLAVVEELGQTWAGW